MKTMEVHSGNIRTNASPTNIIECINSQIKLSGKRINGGKVKEKGKSKHQFIIVHFSSLLFKVFLSIRVQCDHVTQ